MWWWDRRRRRRLAHYQTALSALGEVGRAIVAAQLDVDELCMLIYRQARQIVDTWTFQLGLFEGDSYRIKVWFRRGERQPETVFDLGEGEGIVGWMRRTKQPLLVHDFRSELDTIPARPRYISDDPPRSAVFVPLIAGETVVGAMAIQSYRTDAFSQDHQRLLSIIANQAAAAIANARLYHAERQRRQMADTLRQVSTLINSSLESDDVLRGILEGLERLVRFDAAAILLLDEEKKTLTLQAARGSPALEAAVGQNWPVGDGQRLRQLAQARRALLFGPKDEMGAYHRLLDLPANHSCLGAPISTHDQLLGVLTVDCQEPDQYSTEDAALVAALAAQAASALENARLYATGQEEAWISTALLEVAEATSLAESIDEVLETVVRITPLLIGVDRCAILLWDQEREACQVVATYALDENGANLEQGQLIYPGDWLLLDQLWESGSPVVDEFGGMPGAPDTQDVETTLLALPLRAQGELNGTMVIGFTGQVSFSEYRLKLIAGIANQAALAVESAQLAAAQQEEAWVSQALLQVAEAVANLSELDDVLDVVSRLTPLLVGVESCLIYLWDAAGQAYVPGAAFGLRHERLDAFHRTPIPLCDWPTMSFTCPADEGSSLPEVNGATALVPGPPPPIAEVLGMHAPFALPLLVWGDVMGALVVDTHDGSALLSGRRFNLLSGVAQQTATAIQNARLSIESVERQKLERELDLARQIQVSFLPGQVPEVPGWDLAAHWQGARQVSGDFYDFIPLLDADSPRERWGLVIADVADKGVPAALFTALSRTLVRTIARDGRDPAQALVRANDLILADSRSDLFVTLFYAILDPDQGILTYANAGHNLPLLFADGADQVTALEAEGMAMGVVAGIKLEQKTVQLKAGDLVLFYTDGVTDALNDEVQEFGLERLRRVVEAHRTEPAAAVVRAIDQAVSDFVGHTPQFDDLTLVVLKRQAQWPTT
jgi:serine phosphatase RsbU (regulator of sigma subunit)